MDTPMDRRIFLDKTNKYVELRRQKSPHHRILLLGHPFFHPPRPLNTFSLSETCETSHDTNSSTNIIILSSSARSKQHAQKCRIIWSQRTTANGQEGDQRKNRPLVSSLDEQNCYVQSNGEETRWFENMEFLEDSCTPPLPPEDARSTIMFEIINWQDVVVSFTTHHTRVL